MKKNIFYLLTFFVTLPSFALDVDVSCPAESAPAIAAEMKILGYEGSYVGVALNNKPVFYNSQLERLYIFNDGLSSPPVEMSHNPQTDLRLNGGTHSPFVRRDLRKLSSYLPSLGVRICGNRSAQSDPRNKDVINKANSASCTDIGVSFPATGGKCCEGLTYNPNTQTCDEPTFKDIDLQVCSSDSQCSGGLGCLPLKADYMFTKESADEAITERTEVLREALDEQTNESEFLPAGESCSHSYQCSSYNCLSGKCQEAAKVCRFGDEDEKVNENVKCDESKDLIRNSNGVCELSAEGKNALYLGLYEPGFVLFEELPENTAGKCQYRMNDGVEERTKQALKSIRAMEWLFATISRSDSDDCFQINRKLRDHIGKPFLETRKYLLQDFSTYYSAIKKDYEIVKAALMSNTDPNVQSNEVVSVHGGVNQGENNGQQLTEYELATRQTSGYDSLMFMIRRNQAFKSYEEGMIANISNAYQQISSLNEKMSEWKDGDTSWNLGDRLVSHFSCGAKYKKLTWKGWRTRRYNNIANRWTDYYEVTGQAGLNLNPTQDEQVIEQLKLIGILDDADVLRAFNRKHYLLDPLMPGKTTSQGALAFTQFGDKKRLRSSSLRKTFRKKDQRNPRYLRGNGNNNSYSGIRSEFKSRIMAFYEEMKLNPDQQDFIFEPELVSTDAVDCISKIKNGTLSADDKCSEFDQFIDDLTDYGMAHFLAYSYHRNSKYSNYFKNARTWRRRLFSRLEVDMQNLNRYYTDLVQMRTKQISCLESVVNNVSHKFVGLGRTVGQGGKNYYDGGVYSGNNSGSVKVNAKVSALSAANRDLYSFKANTSAWRGITDTLSNSSSFGNDSSNNGGGSSGVSGAGVSSTSSAFNRRREIMDQSNKKLSERGINVSSKDSKFLASLGSANNSSGKSNSSLTTKSGPGSQNFRSGKGFDLNYKDNLGGDLKLDSDSQASVSPQGDSASARESSRGGAAKMGGSFRGDSFRESSYGYGSGANGSGSDSSQSAVNYQDPTGMSDDEKSVMMANLERTKGRYKPDDSDSLFDVVSKAYVRNLEKVLTRRKRID